MIQMAINMMNISSKDITQGGAISKTSLIVIWMFLSCTTFDGGHNQQITTILV